MNSRRFSSGSAPRIALKNALDARGNIERKLARMKGVFELFVAGTTAKSTVESLPRSARRFNGWSETGTDGDSTNSFTSNSNETLRKNEDLWAQLREMIGQIEKIAVVPTNGKKPTVASLEKRLSTEESLRSISERELTRSSIAQASGHEALLDERTRRQSSEARAQEEISGLQAQLEHYRRINAELITLVKKTTGLKAL